MNDDDDLSVRIHNAVALGLHATTLAHDDAGNVIGPIGLMVERVAAEVLQSLRLFAESPYKPEHQPPYHYHLPKGFDPLG